MFVSECLNVNEKGHLTIGGCDTVELAKEYGTPLYVIDEDTVRNTCRSYVNSMKKYYNGNGLPLYASKALSCKALVQLAMSENMGLDVVSGGELYTAMQAGFPAEKIQFHGNNKTDEELEMLEEAGALQDISHMPSRVKCAVLGWHTLEEMLREGGSDKEVTTENE